MSEYLRQYIVDCDFNSPPEFVEPFCGGAGAALNLLADDHVGCVRLNDADIRIYSAWKAITEETERFVSAIHDVPVSLDEWHSQKQIATQSSASYSFELGFATFFINRTSRSGIVDNSGPIGGYQQTGKWKICARFNRAGLAKRVTWIGSHSNRIFISNLDALSFISKVVRSHDSTSKVFFIDPPYVRAGSRLYHNGMNEAKHIALSDILLSQQVPNWVLTYDDAELIRNLYRQQRVATISVNYSLQRKRKESELLVTPVR